MRSEQRVGMVNTSEAAAVPESLDPFIRQRTALLTTYRRDGTPVGTPVHIAVAGDEAIHAGRMLARKYPILHGVLIPLFHRLRHYRTMHIELTPTGIAH
ncbi:MAG: PNPOx family protein [Thermomicrobiales bacterium]